MIQRMMKVFSLAAIFIIQQPDGTPKSCYVHDPKTPWLLFEVPCYMMAPEVSADEVQKYVRKCTQERTCERLKT